MDTSNIVDIFYHNEVEINEWTSTAKMSLLLCAKSCLFMHRRTGVSRSMGPAAIAVKKKLGYKSRDVLVREDSYSPFSVVALSDVLSIRRLMKKELLEKSRLF